MPRDLGKAKRADLTGKFPGEQAEYGSALARFLEGSGQLRPVTEGTYLEAPGNGHGKDTESARNRTETGRSKDTEVAPARGGNGQHFAADTAFDTQFSEEFAQDEMFPEAALSPEPMSPEPMSPEPMTPEALSPEALAPQALSPEPAGKPARRPEPQSLDSVPDLLSPELDSLSEESSDDGSDDTELLADRAAPRVQELPPPEHSEDTGMLIAEAFSTRKEDGWDSIELDNLDEDDEAERKITDKLNRRPEGDEDLTKVLPADSHSHDGEKITNKVEPRRDVDPRAQDPNSVVRDTVNFYNQTQSFQEARKSAGFPTISPNVVNSGQPLGLRDELASRGPQRPPLEPAASLEVSFGDDDNDSDTLRPGPAPSLELEPALGALAPLEEPALAADIEPELSAEVEPAAGPAELSAESNIEDADQRETDKFTREDREPPQMPVPEGTDKVDKSQAPKHRKAARKDGEPEGLEPLADEKVAAGKDTQRFYVAEILAKKAAADSTDELQPAEEGPPPRAAARAAGETSSDYTTGSAPARRPGKQKTEIEPLPQPREVHTDFIEHIHVSASERIIPGLDDADDVLDAGPAPDEVEESDGDDTVDEEASAVERTTDKLGAGLPPARAEAKSASGRRAAPAPSRGTDRSAGSGRGKRIPEAVSQRLEQERAETLRLIEQAEAVALRLRAASDASASDLVAISARRETVRATRQELQAPVHAAADETLYEAPPPEIAGEVTERDATERETAEISERAKPAPARRVPDRVPTRAIGEMVNELQRSAERGPASLSELLDQVSRRSAPTGGNGNHDGAAIDDDLDMLVAASSRLRETVESAGDEDRISGRVPAADDGASPAASASARRAPESALSGDLDRLWQVLDSRRATAVSGRAQLEPATLLIPSADKARITAREPDLAGLDDGWTQEMLWPTLAGIAVVTFILGMVFVWVLVRALA